MEKLLLADSVFLSFFLFVSPLHGKSWRLAVLLEFDGKNVHLSDDSVVLFLTASTFVDIEVLQLQMILGRIMFPSKWDIERGW